MRWAIRIVARVMFIAIWFTLGLVQGDCITGFASAAASFILMEICYTVDRKTCGVDHILSRIDYLDETSEEAMKTRDEIVGQLNVIHDSTPSDTAYDLGFKAGVETSVNVVKSRFNQVSTDLSKKRLAEENT